jgi:hypothetical protein
MNAQKDAVTLLIDRETHLPVKNIFVIGDENSKQQDQVAETYDNWKRIH